MKIDVIRCNENGKKTNGITHLFNLAPSTISTIIKLADSIIKAAESVPFIQVPRTTHTGDPAIDKMETMLELWTSDLVRLLMPLSPALISAKDQALWNYIQDKLPPDEKVTT